VYGLAGEKKKKPWSGQNEKGNGGDERTDIGLNKVNNSSRGVRDQKEKEGNNRGTTFDIH